MEQSHPGRPPRWFEYNYSEPGYYFVTTCVAWREPVLATVVGQTLVPTELGRIVLEAIRELPSLYPGLHVLARVVMPDHVHLVLRFDGHKGEWSLSDVVTRLKGATARRINEYRGTRGRTFWQSGFFDRVLRDTMELGKTIEYVQANPQRLIERLHGRNQGGP